MEVYKIMFAHEISEWIKRENEQTIKYYDVIYFARSLGNIHKKELFCQNAKNIHQNSAIN